MRKTENKVSRGRTAGKELGKAIIEMAELMYQENTKKNFLDGLYEEVKHALRKIIQKQKKAAKLLEKGG